MGTRSILLILVGFLLCGAVTLAAEAGRRFRKWWLDRKRAQRCVAELDRFRRVLEDVRHEDGPVQVGSPPNVPGVPTAELAGGPRDGAIMPVLVMREQWPHVLHVPADPDGHQPELARYVWDHVTVLEDGQTPVYAYAPRGESDAG